jgi:tetratricopeptide (TPR) repeat protein
MAEIGATARSGASDRVISLASQALEAFLQEDFTESARLAEAAKSLAPRSGRIAELLGLAYYHAGRWKDALRELLSYRRMTGLPEQNHVIADCYRALGRPDRALEILSEVPPDSTPPDVWAETMIVAAGALADKGQIDRALATLSRADLNPESVEPYHLRLWYMRSDLLERAKRREEAIEGWRSIVAEDPEFFDAAQRLQAQLKGGR